MQRNTNVNVSSFRYMSVNYIIVLLKCYRWIRWNCDTFLQLYSIHYTHYTQWIVSTVQIMQSCIQRCIIYDIHWNSCNLHHSCGEDSCACPIITFIQRFEWFLIYLFLWIWSCEREGTQSQLILSSAKRIYWRENRIYCALYHFTWKS